MQAQFAKMESQLPQQRAMIEEQCKNVAPEMCQQMKQAFEASMAMMGGGGAWDVIPDPTSSEKSLLEEYQGQLLGLLNAEE